MSVRLNPEIATMWLVPVVEKASFSSAGMPDSTPRRIPANSEACGSGNRRSNVVSARALKRYSASRTRLR